MNKILVLVCLLMLLNTNRIHSQTHTESEEFVPKWAKSAVWYQIFPERFRNGDPTNDPQMKDIIGAIRRRNPTKWTPSISSVTRYLYFSEIPDWSVA